LSKGAAEKAEQRAERFRAIYESTRPRLLAYALRRTRSPEDAADVVAETFAIAWRRLDAVPEGNASLLWLYATARKVLANHHRQALRRFELVDRLGSLLERALVSEQAIGDDQLAARSALRRLDGDDRELLMLASWEGLGSADLAQLLGCSPTAVRIRLHRARARLAAAMEAVGLDEKHSEASRQ
jgi:RNA polymerase sigma factor (sigma-70 family)